MTSSCIGNRRLSPACVDSPALSGLLIIISARWLMSWTAKKERGEVQGGGMEVGGKQKPVGGGGLVPPARRDIGGDNEERISPDESKQIEALRSVRSPP